MMGKEPIRVLQVVTQMHRAGLETMLMNYYRQIDREKVQFDFLVHREGDFEYDDEIRALGGRIYRVPSISPKTFLSYRKALKVFFATHREYRVVHAHLDALSAFCLAAAQMAGVPVRIAHSHNNYFETDAKLPLRIIAKRFIPCYATHFWGCSREALTFMFGKKCKGMILPNAIDMEKFRFSSEERETLRKELNLTNAFVVGHIGRFSQQKNHGFLLDVFAKILKKRPDAVLIMAGTGPLEEMVRQKAMRMGIFDRMRFLGSREDIARYYSAMDVFLLPSLFEGFGIVLLEAQVSGLWCVSSDNITREVDVTERIVHLPLTKTADEWAETVLKCAESSFHREYEETERLQEYDIKAAAEKLQQEYMRLWERERQNESAADFFRQ